MKTVISIIVVFFALNINLYSQEQEVFKDLASDSVIGKHSLKFRFLTETAAGLGASAIIVALNNPNVLLGPEFLYSTVFGMSTILFIGEYVFEDEGSLGWGIAGEIFGVFSGLLLAGGSFDQKFPGILAFAGIILSPPLFTAYGYNIHEIHKSIDERAVLNRDDRFQIGIPKITIGSNPAFPNDLQVELSLIRIRF